MSDQPTITDQAIEAYRNAAIGDHVCQEPLDCCIRAGLAAAAPHIAAQALRELYAEIARRPGLADIADLIDARADEYSELAGRPGSSPATRTTDDGSCQCEAYDCAGECCGVGNCTCSPAPGDPHPRGGPAPRTEPADPWDVASLEQLAHCPTTGAHTAHNWTDGVQTHRCPGSITMVRPPRTGGQVAAVHIRGGCSACRPGIGCNATLPGHCRADQVEPATPTETAGCTNCLGSGDR